MEMLGNHPLKSFAKAPGGSRLDPAEGQCMASAPHPCLSRAGYMKGWNSQNYNRIKLMVPTGRNSRAPGGSLLWLRASPNEGKPPAASRLLEEQLQFHTHRSNISQCPRILPCWETASAPSGLLFLPSLASSPASSETHQHRRAASCRQQPQAVTLRTGRAAGSTHWDTPRAGRKDGERRMESG